MKKGIGLLIIGILFFIFPVQTFAVDLTIDETEIRAYLQENGDVQVEETHTYTFDGDFNGITRTLIPKDDTSITNFKATENGEALEVEQEDALYRAYRGGKNETFTVELSYLIENGMEIYTDAAQFYWSFFDSGNESDYENLTISVHPPESTGDVIAYGEDKARATETVNSSGVVTFDMGLVESGEEGGIRVAYDESLFPAASVTDKEMRNEIVAAKNESDEDHAAFLSRQESLNNLAPIITAVFGLLLFGLLFYAFRKKKSTDYEAERIYHSPSFVPREIMSMPATVYYYRSYMIGHGEMLTTGMMDLVRKGNIETIDEESYRLINRKTNHEHESKLIELLFEIIGDGDTFSFREMDHYTKNEQNTDTFNTAIHEYLTAVREEIKTNDLYYKHKKLRWTVGLTSLLLIPMVVVLGFHDLWMWAFFQILIMFGLLFFSFVFAPKKPEAKVIKKRWKDFEGKYAELPAEKWDALDENEKERALVFTSGSNNDEVKEKNTQLMENYNITSDSSAYFLVTLFTLSAVGNDHFDHSVQVTSAAGSTATAGTGTGVGGGGGGSGGF